MDFLESVASYHLQHYPQSDWSALRFVFPSHRAGRFFRSSLRKQLGSRTIFGLKVQTISELISAKAEMIVPDHLTLIFELYDVYCKVYGKQKDSFEVFEFFFSWAPVFIADFSDVDKYLIDAEQLFRNVSEAHQLSDDYSHLTPGQQQAIFDFWGIALGTSANPDSVLADDYKHRFNATFEHLYEFYTQFREHLSAKKMAYDGMLYRTVAEQYANINFDDEGLHYVFVGFNALTAAEQQIFRTLRNAHKASFFWDYSPDILQRIDPADDLGAGRFLHQLLVDFPAPKDYTLPLPQQRANFKITAFAYSQSQVFGVGEFLKQHYTDESPERTAIVLANENMLLPVLGGLPPSINKVNVTMGYPLRQSQVYGLVDLLARLQISLPAKPKNFAARHVQPILQHACVISPLADNIVQQMVKTNSSRVDATMLTAVPAQGETPDSQLLAAIFRKVEVAEVPDYLRQIFTLIYQRYAEGNQLLRECTYKLLSVINIFGEFVGRNEVEISSMSFVFSLFDSIARTQSVDFRGLPLEGLQIMGFMETRALDFDNIVALDLNEGVFPKSGMQNSFIPHMLRSGFGLPTYAFRDSIFAYYFFRLMTRARNVELFYTTSGGDEAKGISRFLLQLIYQFKLPVVRRVATHTLNISTENQVIVKKTPEMLQLLYQRFSTPERPLSPSTFIRYLECQLTLYYSKVLGLSDQDEVVEEVDNRIFGNIFHSVMENLYKKYPLLSAENKKAITANKALVDSLLCQAFEHEFNREVKSIDDLESRNYLIYNVIKDYVFRAVQAEPTDLNVLECEKKAVTAFELPDGKVIYLGGIIDRIHREADGSLCILDYKTGKVDDKNYKYTDISNLFGSAKEVKSQKALLQTLIYAYILRKLSALTSHSDYQLNRPFADDIHFRILTLMKVSSHDYSSVVKSKTKDSKEETELTYNQIENEFAAALQTHINNLFSPEEPHDTFAPTTDPKMCEYCDFRLLCHFSKRNAQ